MSRTGPQPMFRDRAPAVDAFEARTTSPVRRCPACLRDSHRVAVGVRRDLYECSCGASYWLWACCGEVPETVEPGTEYRADAVCPKCGADRFGAQIAPNMIGVIEGVETVHCCGPEED